MPLNFKILDKVGTTDWRIRQIMTAVALPGPGDDSDEWKARVKANEEDMRNRKRIEEMLQSRIQEAIEQSFQRHQLYSVADLAWDAAPINRSTVPLLLFAQGKMSMESCVKALEDSNGGQYIERSGEKAVAINKPKFVYSEKNLVRSVISRRLAAQMNRFNNLWPFFKYEARSTKPEAKLRADAVSQVSDTCSDQFGYRGLQEQVVRDIMLYQNVTIFPTCKWQRDVEWVAADTDPVFKADTVPDKFEWQTRVTREGVPFTVAHPSRTFFDSAHPRSSINTDTGCSWFGHWDVARWESIRDAAGYYNRDSVSFNAVNSQFAISDHPYFLQYFSTVLAPVLPNQQDPSLANDRQVKVGAYSGLAGDSSVFLTHFMVKLKPIEYGIGTYPFPVWIHFTVAGDIGTVVHAEIMPDVPGVHFAFNGSDHRSQNLSILHDLIGHQDCINNLSNQALEEIRRDLLTVFCLNTEVFDTTEDAKGAREQFIEHLKGGQFFEDPIILAAQFSKLKTLIGADAFSADNIFKVIRTTPNTKITDLYTAMAQELAMAERLVALSPQEQGQMSPRETSATEVQIVATTTENVYSFISDAIDAGRAAWKRYLYNSFVSCASDELTIPVVDRYPESVVAKAGFRAVSDGGEQPAAGGPDGPKFISIIGSRWSLVEELTFNSRDGAERSSNVQAATALTQLLQVILATPAAGAITNDQFAVIVNEIARLGGSGVDLNLKFPAERGSQPLVPPAPAPPAPPQPTQPSETLPSAPSLTMVN